MNGRGRKRLFAALALALLVGGGALAAVTAAQGSGRAPHRPRTTLGIAAAYLGLSEAQLRRDTRSGESLAQVAKASGHSTKGLIEAIVSARRSRLEAQLAALQSRVSAQVTRTRGARGAGGALGAGAGAGGATVRGPLAAAASYLGLSGAQLRTELRAGRTLAQIAQATPGRSRAGLIAALLAGRRARLDALVAEGALTAAREQRWLSLLQARIGARVDRRSQPLPPSSRARAARRARALRARARARARALALARRSRAHARSRARRAAAHAAPARG
jgi:hypothetical protein